MFVDAQDPENHGTANSWQDHGADGKTAEAISELCGAKRGPGGEHNVMLRRYFGRLNNTFCGDRGLAMHQKQHGFHQDDLFLMIFRRVSFSFGASTRNGLPLCPLKANFVSYPRLSDNSVERLGSFGAERW